MTEQGHNIIMSRSHNKVSSFVKLGRLMLDGIVEACTKHLKKFFGIKLFLFLFFFFLVVKLKNSLRKYLYSGMYGF